MTSFLRNIFRVVCFFCLSSFLWAADPVEGWLGRQIIAPTQTLAEVQSFTESRVPLMPDVKTARDWDRIAGRLRRETLERVVFRGEAARWRDARTRVEWLDTIE